MSIESKEKISKIINEKYKNYPELQYIKDRIKDIYLKEYEHISKYKKQFNVDTEEEIINLTFEKINKLWNKILN